MTMNEAPPPVPPTELPMKRFKFVWRFLLLSNLALGAFLFARAKRRDSMEIHRKRTAHRLHKSKATVEVPPEPITSSLDLNYEDFLVPVTVPVVVRAPIAEEQQREVFKWMLEEKRKVKPKDAMEKKQIDEEKYILKQFLRAKSIPKF
ncbi:WAS/WASL-interacting family protein [Trifolium repens]|nr:WAS/WASL-interacting family protein [Trifolium repens]